MSMKFFILKTFHDEKNVIFRKGRKKDGNKRTKTSRRMALQ